MNRRTSSKKQTKQNKTKPLRHITFPPLRGKAILIMKTPLSSIYVLFVPFRKSQPNCALRRAQYLSLLEPHSAHV